MPNRLAAETSPYLLQHADNPVDWYPWGPEAFEKAQAENKPILLSVGYSACHWCHVMAHESFEDEKIAAIMNACFVNIKVDREERPDVDAIYMAAVQAMTRHGGWPMTVFLTPQGKPFYGGTYFPPNERPGQPSFPRVLSSIAEHYATNPTDITTTSDRLTAHLAEFGQQTAAPDALTLTTLDRAVVALKSVFDPENGGFGGAPKFPPSHSLEFLLRTHLRNQDPQALAMVEHTLEKMARGGLYDQLGGGFHRYATDEIWLVPHFEKMLYDNAQLARVYLLAYQATRKVLYEVVATETLDYVVREMTDEQGGFYTAQDADSEGVEGKFFVWSYDEVLSLLGAEDGKLFAAAFDVTPQGNFESESVLNLPQPLGVIAKREGVAVDRLGEAISRGRVVLFEAREARVKPGRDEKVLTAWNGMMLRAFAQAATALERPDYLLVAEKNADFVLSQLRAPDGKLLRTWSAGQAKLNAYLEDYAQYIDGLLAVYEASFTPRWLNEALALTEVMLKEFLDPESGLLYDTGKSHETLITRPRDLFDNATPSGNSVAAEVLLRLAHLTGEQRFSDHAQAILAAAGQMMLKYASGAGRMLCALDFHLATVREIALVGPADSEAMRAFKRGVYHHYRPHLVVAGGDDQAVAELAGRVALLRDRPAKDGRATAYVCTGFVCQAPTHDPAEMLRQLGPE